MKKLWKQNKVLLMLIIILVLCFIAIVAVVATFFYSNDVGTYGARLEGIENYPITEELKEEYTSSLKENELVEEVKFNIIGRVVYVHVKGEEELAKMQKKVESSLNIFSEDLLSYYDFNFVLKGTDYSIIGAKNAKNDYIAWNNNKEVKEEEEENEEA